MNTYLSLYPVLKIHGFQLAYWQALVIFVDALLL